MSNVRSVPIWTGESAKGDYGAFALTVSNPDPAPPPNGWMVPAGVPVTGAHGGSGATTIAAFLANSASSCRSSLEVYDAGTLMPGTVNGPALVVTARGTAAGTAAAQRMVGAVQQLHQLPVVVIVTSDGPWPLPPAVRGRLRALSGRAAVIRLPYVARWRFIDMPGEPPARYTAQINRALAALERCRTVTSGAVGRHTGNPNR